jgi:RNA polymerase sigma factor for flagellar operon FliA
VTLDECVQQYAPIVRRLAQRVAASLPASYELDDLIQVGLLGLMDAHKRHKGEAYGAAFLTYATYRIRGAIFDELRRSSWAPRKVLAIQKRVAAVEAELANTLGRRPTRREIKDALGSARGFADAVVAQIFLYEDLLDNDDPRRGDVFSRLFPSWEAEPLGRLIKQEEREHLLRAISRLPGDEQKVLLACLEDEPQHRIAKKLGLSESRISQLRRQGIRRLVRASAQ